MSDETAVIEPGTTVERTWGALVGRQHYRADVLLAPQGNMLPPDWMTFAFADAANDGELSPENFLDGIAAPLAMLGSTVLSVALEPIDEPTYHALALSQVGG